MLQIFLLVAKKLDMALHAPFFLFSGCIYFFLGMIQSTEIGNV